MMGRAEAEAAIMTGMASVAMRYSVVMISFACAVLSVRRINAVLHLSLVPYELRLGRWVSDVPVVNAILSSCSRARGAMPVFV